MKSGTNAEHLCQISLLSFDRSKSRSKPPYWNSSNYNSSPVA